MSYIKYIFIIILIFNKTLQYYKLKYGRLIINYYNNEMCVNSINETIEYPISDDEEENELLVLNEDNLMVRYPFSFDFFASEISYSNSTDDEDDKGDVYKRSLLCNGICNKRQSSDIILDPETKLVGDYKILSNVYKYYSCIYNNIIKTATVDITFYEDKKCKKKIINTTRFNGSDSCWNINVSNYSFKPLYYEDDSKKVYYHSYYTDDCSSKYIDYFIINDNYLKCDSKCNINKTNKTTSYKCTFKANKGYNIKQKIFLLFLYFILLFKLI